MGLGFCFSQFVAHPICQQVLSSIWCGNLAGWRGSRTAWKLLVSVGIFLTMPILCLVYWIAPKSKVTTQGDDSGDTRVSALTKFISFCVFSAGGKDPENSCYQVPAALSVLPVVPHHIVGRVNNNGDVPRPVCLQEAEHVAQLLPHGLGCRWVSLWLSFCDSEMGTQFIIWTLCSHCPCFH